ncbi:photosystem II 5 kDa protein, chloroplastic-like [Aristolochia californica]|uniref:photosystem II 5 kDa protein, chloroplastic-like n=1 Tax=Aristolochia californica TaxID=171875 RepID=UPI0035D8DBA1
MASISMTTSLIGGLGNAVRSSVNHRQVVMAKAARVDDGVEQRYVSGDQSNNTRRNLMFAAAASAVCSAAAGCGVALADEPKRGSPEAKKKYAPICVTMPTASVCHN